MKREGGEKIEEYVLEDLWWVRNICKMKIIINRFLSSKKETKTCGVKTRKEKLFSFV